MFTQVFTILPLTCAIFVLLFGFFVLSKDFKPRMNQLLFGFCCSMFFWMFGTFMMFGTRVSDAEAAIFWDRFVYIGVVFMPSFMHHFSLIFTKRKNQKNLLIINYFLSFLFLVISRTSYFVDGLYIYEWGAHTKAQVFHHIFLFYFFLGTGLFFYNVYSYYGQLKDKLLKLQTLYVFLAFAIVIFIGGSAYLYAYGVDTKFPFAYFTGLVFPILLFYAVTRHHLLGAKVVVTEVLVGVASFVLVTEIFLAKTTTELLIRLLFAIIVVLIGVLLVISVRKEIQRREEMVKLADSLETANLKLKELDQQKTDFLSIASHQLRTPLSILKGYIELIKDDAYGKPAKGIVKVLDEMDESNERLVKLVDEFLNITRIEQGRTKFDFAPCSMDKIIDSVVKEIGERAEKKGLALKEAAKATVPQISADEEKIRHVIFNFVDNAIKYSGKGTITISLKVEQNGLAVRVKDEGIGFDKADGANFFQKFYRGANVKNISINGTGLGLYVCRKFIEAHNGRVWAESQGIGRGSEFGFWIPLAFSRSK